MGAISFTITGPPRTKKTHQEIVHIKPKNGGRGFTKIIPSEAFREWFKAALWQAPQIRRALAAQGVNLPLAGPVNARVFFYRDRLSGDATGFYQALADYLQEPLQKNGKTIRQGAGIIKDDRQIVQWDGSRLRKDAACPRIEVTLEILSEGQGELPLEEEW